jgi:hypothetical protein
MSKAKDKGRIGGYFTPLQHEIMDCPAWRAMSHGAQVLYLALRRRYGFDARNNGKIFLSQREASTQLCSSSNQIARWFRELQHYSFIIMTDPGCLGVEGKGRAPRFLLPELGYMNEPPTKDYLRWNGTPFKDSPKTESRNGNPLRSVTGIHYGSVTENRYTPPEKSNGKPLHADSKSVTENRYSSRLTISKDSGSVERHAAGIGHNRGPRLDGDRWSTPVLTELKWSEDWARLCRETAGDLTIPDVLRRDLPVASVGLN